MREWYRRKTPEERRAWVAKRDQARVRAYDRKRYREQPHRQNPAAQRDPIKLAAARAVSNAVRRGKIVKPSECEECHESFEPTHITAHHEDYSKRLDVVWLCHACHARRHRKDDDAFVA